MAMDDDTTDVADHVVAMRRDDDGTTVNEPTVERRPTMNTNDIERADESVEQVA
jgi:hypothetical protein